MSEYVVVYGTKIKLPPRPKDEEAVNFGRPRKEQKWERGELPDFFNDVSYTKDGKLTLTAEQDKYAEQELDRCRNGLWIWIGERMRYVTGRYYFYLKYYVLEDGNAPEFREADRLYFLFWQHWFNILWCLGLVRIKKRRQGASSQSCSNILYEAIFFKNSNCGLLSKTRDDSKATFTEMVTNAYQLLPCFFKQRLQGKEDAVTELVLIHDKGSYSKINYKAPVLNAYDRGRMSYVLLDEGGKYPQETPVSRLLAIISKTLVKGVKRVGWLDAPSTVNELTKGGGAEYKKVFEAANQFKRPVTINRLVRFFQPAYEAYEGFIDEYGDSVVDEPTEEQYNYLVERWVQKNEDGDLISELSEEDIKLGAKVYVMTKRRDGLSGVDLEEETRMNPCTEEEAFMFAGQGCEFNSTNINNQIKELEENPVYIRQARLVSKKEKLPKKFPTEKDKDREVIGFMDDSKGGWFILEPPNKPNEYTEFGGFLEPKNTILYQLGIDTTQNRIAIAGSNPAITVFKKSCLIDGEETGMYPVAMWISPTRLDIDFDEEVRKACLWYGAKANYEIDRRVDFWRYFCQKKCQAFLTWTPTILRNPLKPNKPLEYGSRSGDSFQLAQMLQVSKIYLDGDSSEVYNGHVHRIKFIELLKQALVYDHLDRGKSDLFVSLQMCLVAVFGDMQKIPKSESRINILPTYKINLAV